MNNQPTTECKECGGEGIIDHEVISINSVMDYYKPVDCPSCKGTVVLKSGVAGLMKKNGNLTLLCFVSILLNLTLLVYIFSC
jgi:hypothetical protein